MPPKQPQKSKAQKALAAASSSRSKGKKKWSKGKVREKKNYAVVLSPELYKKLFAGVPKMKMITVYTMVEAYKINASVARRCIKELASKGKIKCISNHSRMPIYTKA
uniref:40S ribosomal protein S25 n=1 Tax=Lotharella globosa TaxID=91324 RepID=A0A6V3U965_9EUKA|mmetsp:Transcript_18885/g.38161  ORF Transcript_18885/g.38161 Transcript_18885/m.38161 type:complete len:107 (-) Transcript_18885:77-397(-)|eukprot:CAMPEP_0167782374 /NCGR_PEP_ID=MMETSP0111_2-20121227/6481_1 /TAXON_ID=91324 /ORGANISM="Lotharella globosa, Strain CCCM811" /LENGTH=106 /DNA_ID=CAMNT_0007673197 /DNA_START=38 /DNA_END=358 /DNA_ORIENTATION=+